ncbi:MAG TPA: hypothetical protein VD908_12925 [Cytophagales bacterium]|nr:hypothetical protein [Cytophagales bacterium]
MCNYSGIYHPAVPAPLLEKGGEWILGIGLRNNKKEKNSHYNDIVDCKVSLLPSRREI